MADSLSIVVGALAALLGLREIDAREIARGEIASVFPDARAPGEIVGNVLLVADVPWMSVVRRLDDPARQPGVVAGGRLDPEEHDSLGRFLREARLDEDDPGRLRSCRAECRLKVTDSLLKGQRDLPQPASETERQQTFLRGIAALGPCLKDPACDVTLIDKKATFSLGAVTRRLLGEPSLSQQLSDSPAAGGASRLEWRTEAYWNREVLSLGRIRIVEGQFRGHRAILHRREIGFATHYLDGARVETLFVEADGRVVVAQSNIYQTDKRSGFSGIERALIRFLGRRRFEGQAAEWRREKVERQ